MLVELLSANYTEIRHNPAGAVPAGTLTVIEDSIGFPITDVAAGEIGVFIIKAEKVKVVKLTGVVFKEGEALYWLSAGTDNVTNVYADADSKFLGFATEDVATAVLETVIDFDGKLDFTFAIAQANAAAIAAL